MGCYQKSVLPWAAVSGECLILITPPTRALPSTQRPINLQHSRVSNPCYKGLVYLSRVHLWWLSINVHNWVCLNYTNNFFDLNVFSSRNVILFIVVLQNWYLFFSRLIAATLRIPTYFVYFFHFLSSYLTDLPLLSWPSVRIFSWFLGVVSWL
jgi:hypothetical protein